MKYSHNTNNFELSLKRGEIMFVDNKPALNETRIVTADQIRLKDKEANIEYTLEFRDDSRTLTYMNVKTPAGSITKKLDPDTKEYVVTKKPVVATDESQKNKPKRLYAFSDEGRYLSKVASIIDDNFKSTHSADTALVYLTKAQGPLPR